MRTVESIITLDPYQPPLRIGQRMRVTFDGGVNRVEPHNVAFSLSGWFQDHPDPSDFLDVLFSTRAISDVESNNMAFYSSTKADELMAAADLETNPQKRMDLYEQAEVVMEDTPVVPLVDGVEIWLHQSWVKGFALHPVWLVRYEKLSISPP